MIRTDQSRPNALAVLLAGSPPAAIPLAQNAMSAVRRAHIGILNQLARCQYRDANRKERDDRPGRAFRRHSTALTTALKSP